LIDQIESSNTLLQKLIEIAKEWNECLESLYVSLFNFYLNIFFRNFETPIK